MSADKSRLVIISDFNVANLTGYLRNDEEDPQVEVIDGDYGNVIAALLQEDSSYRAGTPDFAVIWTQPEAVIESFRKALDYQISLDEILAEVDTFASMLLKFQDGMKATLVMTWVLPTYNRGVGMLDMKAGVGLSDTVMRMNVRLAENLQNAPGVYLLDAQRWIGSAGKRAFDPKLWYLAKIPFGNEVFVDAAKDIKAALRGLMGQARKLIVLDLDDTLWGGIVGEIGWEDLRLGGHDPVGEAYVDFQRSLKALTNRGILLAIASKNEEEVALEALRKNPAMVLRLEDFVGWRINWQDKAQNIVDLVRELNLGLDSVVFIDDSPVERARVQDALPEVFVPPWPEEAMFYKRALLGLHCFDSPSISQEDRLRTQLYSTERRRESLRREVGSVEDWLSSLEIRVRIDELSRANLQRAAQLLNKTNQMNLSTRRMSDAELLEWSSGERRKVWTFNVSDKFGDAGIVGLVSIELQDDGVAKVVDFVMSCRTLGRNVEETMVSTAVKYTRGLGAKKLIANCIPTSKNMPCIAFWRNSRFVHEQDNQFSWDLEDEYETPPFIRTEDDSDRRDSELAQVGR